MTNESERNTKERCTQYEVDRGLVKSGGQQEACVVCKGFHQLNDCHVCKTKTIRQRNFRVRTHRLCLNCLNAGHFAFHCKSRSQCLSCRRKHHSLLHKEVAADQEIPNGLKTRTETNNPPDKDLINIKQVDGTSKDSVSVSAVASHFFARTETTC